MIGALERKITLDLNRTGVQTRIPVRQGDSLVHRITISLSWNGKAYFPDDVTWAEVCALLPDGSTVTADCEIAGRKCTFVPGAGFFGGSGPVLCRLILRGADGGELYSPAFAFDAEGTVNSTNAAEAEAYSRVAELLLQVQAVQKQCEEIAANLGVITSIKKTPVERDWLPIYSTANGEYMKLTWEAVRSTLKDALGGSITASAVADEAGTGYVATIPELEDDAVLALASDIAAALVNYYTKGETYSREEIDSRTVTDAERAAWNAKSDFSGNYADLAGKPTIPTVPTNVSAFSNDAGYVTDADVDTAVDTALTAAKESWTFTLEDGSTVTKNVVIV